MQGFDGKADAISPENIKKAYQNGDFEGYRGMAGKDGSKFAEDLKNGQYFAGYGTYIAETKNGNSNASLEDAKTYAEDGGSVVQVAIKKEAKLGNYSDINNESRKKFEIVEKQRVKSKAEQNQLLHKTYRDPGRYASWYIIDSDHLSADKTQYTVMFNRTVLRISTQNV